MRWNWIIVVSGCALALATGCDKGEKKSSATAGTGQASAGMPTDAKSYFAMKCVVCHGATGAGDGPGGAALNPKPRNMAEAAWQDSVKDDEIRKAILEGGAAIGKSAAMPPNPDLKGKDQLLDDLVKHVRGLKK